VPCYEHLLVHVAEAGWCDWVDGVAKPLDWREIAAWAEMTDTLLTPWEARAVRIMSSEYAGEANAARDPACAPPWPPNDLIDREERERQQAAMAGIFSRLGAERG
jgi:hypothetical protein